MNSSLKHLMQSKGRVLASAPANRNFQLLTILFTERYNNKQLSSIFTFASYLFCQIEMRITLSIVILVALFAGCKQKETDSKSTPRITSSTELKYAEGFSISHIGNTKLVEVTYPYQDATTGIQYVLVNHDDEIPAGLPIGSKIIRVPIKSIVCTSTTHIPLLDYLGETNKLVGFPTTDFISSETMRQRIDSGLVQELGIDKGMNIEQLVALHPDLVMGYTLTGNQGQFKKIEEFGISTVINAEYLEKHPLGRAEWIKFMALFFNKEEIADSVFRMIEQEYQETKILAGESTERPAVLSGIVYGDAWFLPGGRNYGATLFEDAACNYLWSNNESNGFLQLSFETVYEKAHAADLWIGVGSFESHNEIQNADARYAKFKAFKEKRIYSYNGRIGAKGGSEYLELGYLRPDIILKDLVKIAHPELLPTHNLYFHKQLE